jgi:hypothetical protein
MTDQINCDKPSHFIPIKKTCWQKHHPRIPYTHTQNTYDRCGIYSAKTNTSNDTCCVCCSEMALCCCPCACVIDIVCCFPMIFGYYNVKHFII